MRGVPVVDLESADVAAAVDAACRDWGFFQLVGHGVDREVRDDLLRQMHCFFGLPREVKRGVERSATNVWGYYDRELTKNQQDWKEIFDVGPVERVGPLAGSFPQWPESLPEFRAAILAFAESATRVAERLLHLVAHNLGQSAERLDDYFGEEQTSFLRLNHYPRCPKPAPGDSPTAPLAGPLGIHHHTDAGALTVLLQDNQPGLQVQRDGRWHTVQPHEDALVVNIGDIVQVWSNDRYRAPLHRVIAHAAQDRYSAPLFYNPSYATNYAPLSSPPRYRSINWGEFRAQRAAGDYADQGTEIQIAHFLLGR